MGKILHMAIRAITNPTVAPRFNRDVLDCPLNPVFQEMEVRCGQPCNVLMPLAVSPFGK
jgi:hypothetical protein